MKYTKKATHTTFAKKLIELFLENGAVEHKWSIFDGYLVPTKFGSYRCDIEEFCKLGLTVYGRYIDEEKRKSVSNNSTFGMNNINGKFNFHFGYEEDGVAAAEKVMKGILDGYKFI
jgi:hypothetical protein